MGWFVSFLGLRAARASTLGKVLVGHGLPWNPGHPAVPTRGACVGRARSRMLGPHGEATKAVCLAGAGRAGMARKSGLGRSSGADPPPRRPQIRTQRRGRPRPRRSRSPIGGGSEPIVESCRLRSLCWSPPIGPRAAPAFAYFVARK